MNLKVMITNYSESSQRAFLQGSETFQHNLQLHLQTYHSSTLVNPSWTSLKT